MASSQLAVFVHGWGASDKEWWGTTKTSLAANQHAFGTSFYFHIYPSTKAVKPSVWNRLMQLWGKSPKPEVVGELGQTLWNSIRYECESKGVGEITLFGHSFGGIVIADAIRHAAARAREGSQADERALKLIKRIGLCASPIAGAGLAAAYARATALFGQNEHVQNLMANDPKRQQAVDAFVSFLQGRDATSLTLFYAANDEVVARDEVFSPFRLANVHYAEVSLQGKHSDCIADVGPTSPERSGNFKKLADWLFRGGSDAASTLPAEPAQSSTAGRNGLDQARRLRESFDQLVRTLEQAIVAEPFLSWQELRDKSDIKDQYFLRVFLQQLNFAASRINDQSLGSANLWVAHLVPQELHLRSEEREGYFATDQLLVHTPGKVAIRANKVFEKAGSFEQNSAGSRAYLMGEPVLVSTAESKFPSHSDKETGVTHVLGVPLYSRVEFEGIDRDAAEGVPLAITADFHFEGSPTAQQVDEVRSAGRRLTQLFREFSRRWPQGKVRLNLH